MTGPLRFHAASEAALLVVCSEESSERALDRVHALTRALLAAPPVWLRDVHPAYRSILIEHDPLTVTADHVAAHVSALPSDGAASRNTAVHTVPVRYGGPGGPDLTAVARALSLPEAEVIALHTASMLRVAFFGFMPGFAYLSGLDATLTVPRLDVPRTAVEPGSVAIAAGQAAIYPSRGPGGWRLIGSTTIDVMNAGWKLGDRIRFEAVR